MPFPKQYRLECILNKTTPLLTLEFPYLKHLIAVLMNVSILQQNTRFPNSSDLQAWIQKQSSCKVLFYSFRCKEEVS